MNFHMGRATSSQSNKRFIIAVQGEGSMDNSNSNSKSKDVFPLVLDGSAVTEGIHEEEASVLDIL